MYLHGCTHIGIVDHSHLHWNPITHTANTISLLVMLVFFQVMWIVFAQGELWICISHEAHEWQSFCSSLFVFYYVQQKDTNIERFSHTSTRCKECCFEISIAWINEFASIIVLNNVFHLCFGTIDEWLHSIIKIFFVTKAQTTRPLA